jgi:hypothetical protein
MPECLTHSISSYIYPGVHHAIQIHRLRYVRHKAQGTNGFLAEAADDWVTDQLNEARLTVGAHNRSGLVQLGRMCASPRSFI